MDIFKQVFEEEDMGDKLEDAVKKALSLGDEDEDAKEGGGILSFFEGDKDEEKDKEKGGLFSFGDDDEKKKKKDEGKGGFFSDLLDKDDDKGKEKKVGFAGLFNKQEGVDAAGEKEGESAESGGNKGQSAGQNDGDLLKDLIAVADETSKGK